jgi:ABC-type uncharacterized transport system permease subunit
MLKPLLFYGQILIRVQEMAVGIIGLCLGMFFAHVVAGSSSGGFALFALLTMAHLACNYKVAAVPPQFTPGIADAVSQSRPCAV